jgi:hypothetical protein
MFYTAVKFVFSSSGKSVDSRHLRRIFGPKEEEVLSYWRKLYNEELHKVYLHLMFLG